MNDEQIRQLRPKTASDFIGTLRKQGRSLKARAGRAHRTSTHELATPVQIPVLLMFTTMIYSTSRAALAGIHRWFKGLGIYDGDDMNTMGIVFQKYIIQHNIFFL
jgi:hypothetical protein